MRESALELRRRDPVTSLYVHAFNEAVMSVRLIVSAAIVIVALAGCRQEPTYVSPGLTLQQPLTVEMEQVRAAVAKAGEVSKWEVEFTGDNTAIAKRNFKNKHFAVMDVAFDRSGYKITHRSSKNFNYDGKYAHPTYSRFVKDLHDALDYQYRQLGG